MPIEHINSRPSFGISCKPQDINKRFSNHADFIEQESSKLAMENRIANDIKREKAVKKQKIIDFF